jgi:hypothetical protein
MPEITVSELESRKDHRAAGGAWVAAGDLVFDVTGELFHVFPSTHFTMMVSLSVLEEIFNAHRRLIELWRYSNHTTSQLLPRQPWFKQPNGWNGHDLSTDDGLARCRVETSFGC